MTSDLTFLLVGTAPKPVAERPADATEAAAASMFLVALQNLVMIAQPQAGIPAETSGPGPRGVTVPLMTSTTPLPRVAASAVAGTAIDLQVADARGSGAAEARVAPGEALAPESLTLVEPITLVPGETLPTADGKRVHRDAAASAAPLPQALLPNAIDSKLGDNAVFADAVPELPAVEHRAQVADVIARTMPASAVHDRATVKPTASTAAVGASTPSDPGSRAEPIVAPQAAGLVSRQASPEHEGAPPESPAAEALAETASDLVAVEEPASAPTPAMPSVVAAEEARSAATEGSTSAAATVRGLAVAVSDAVHGGEPRIRVALQPEQLGRVDVDLAIGEDGRLQASFTVERPETLQLLQRDQRLLGQALGEAGIVLSDSGLRFSLDERPTERQQGHGQEEPHPRPPEPSMPSSGPPSVPRRQAAGLLDLLV